MGKKDNLSKETRRWIVICGFLALSIWGVIFFFVLPKIVPMNQPTRPIITQLDNSLTYPFAPAGSYWDSWRNEAQTYDKTVWFDRPAAYSAKRIVRHNGWKELKGPNKVKGRAFDANQPYDLDFVKQTKLKLPKDLERDEGLYFVNTKAAFIFTRMYHYKSYEEDYNEQTARLGIDYACPSQLLNHVPGASAFWRKDYFQLYSKAYQSKYEENHLSHWYNTLTPKTYSLIDEMHCQAFLSELKVLMKDYGENMPIRWILKDALLHKGYGIKLVDFQKTLQLLGEYDRPLGCLDMAFDKPNIIAQQYIYNPALIEKRKFDFRVFVIIANIDPLIALWAPENGHSRLSDQEFDDTSTDFSTHITANVHTNNVSDEKFIQEHRYNLRELGQYFYDKNLLNTDVESWLNETAFPKVKEILIHMIRASQQSLIIKREGLFEFYGVDLIMENNLEKFYILESNRRPNVQETNHKLKYREKGVVDDFATVADHVLNVMGKGDFDAETLYSNLKFFVPFIDETQEDPYFGMMSDEWQSIEVKKYDGKLPTDPMLDPLLHHFRGKKFLD